MITICDAGRMDVELSNMESLGNHQSNSKLKKLAQRYGLTWEKP